MKSTEGAVRVLLVDDSALIRKHLTSLLSSLDGVEVVGQAPDAAGGKALIQQLRPDVVVLDIGLPGESGIDLLKTLRPEIASLVIVMFTNYSDPYSRRVCAEAGADYFFDKAMEIEGLVEALRKLVAAFAPGRRQRGDETGVASGDPSA
jgi:DNA-binding NarL/FixJ family response regulator